MSTVVVAVHYQNDVVHLEGRIRAGLSDAGRAALVRNASRLLHTARHAADIGYEVVVAADACASAGPELHAASLRNLELHVARVATVDDVLVDLGGARG